MRKCSYIAGKIVREYKIRKRYERLKANNKLKNSPKKDENKK